MQFSQDFNAFFPHIHGLKKVCVPLFCYDLYTVIPVSYTHLDVYKRQHFRSVVCNLHSIMLLLYLKSLKEVAGLNISTFHYASTLSWGPAVVWKDRLYLHSIMLLLYLFSKNYKNFLLHHLHSIMLLLYRLRSVPGCHP